MLSYLVNLHSRLISGGVADVLRREEGQGLTEYALILVFIAVVAIIALKFLGKQISSLLNSVGGEL